MNQNSYLLLISVKRTCEECKRVFDLLKEKDAQEWYYGHDCES